MLLFPSLFLACALKTLQTLLKIMHISGFPSILQGILHMPLNDFQLEINLSSLSLSLSVVPEKCICFHPFHGRKYFVLNKQQTERERREEAGEHRQLLGCAREPCKAGKKGRSNTVPGNLIISDLLSPRASTCPVLPPFRLGKLWGGSQSALFQRMTMAEKS